MSCETVRMGRKDSLDLDVEAASSPAAAALEEDDSSGREDVQLVLLQADELHQGSKQDKREGFQLLLNNKLAVRLPPPSNLTPTGNENTHGVSNPTKQQGKGDRGERAASAHILLGCLSFPREVLKLPYCLL